MVLLMTPMSLPPALLVWEWPTLAMLGQLVLIGVLGTIGQLTVVQALKEGETHVVMPIDFTKLIWAAILGFLWFHEIPTVFTWLGLRRAKQAAAVADAPHAVPRTPEA
jgi:drug/metabolite transporter (DMT)-like permease